MNTKVQQWGNSQGLRLSKAILTEAAIQVGDEVTVVARDGAIIVTPVRLVRGKYRLEDLVSRIPEGYESEELDWGPPAGNEVW